MGVEAGLELAVHGQDEVGGVGLQEPRLRLKAFYIREFIQVGVERCDVDAGFSGSRGDVSVAEIDIGGLDACEGVANPRGFGQAKGRGAQEAGERVCGRAARDFVGKFQGVKDLGHGDRRDMQNKAAVAGLFNEAGGAGGEILVIVAQKAEYDVGIQLVGGNGHFWIFRQRYAAG